MREEAAQVVDDSEMGRRAGVSAAAGRLATHDSSSRRSTPARLSSPIEEREAIEEREVIDAKKMLPCQGVSVAYQFASGGVNERYCGRTPLPCGPVSTW